jgi:hypothetical protein
MLDYVLNNLAINKNMLKFLLGFYADWHLGSLLKVKYFVRKNDSVCYLIGK